MGNCLYDSSHLSIETNGAKPPSQIARLFVNLGEFIRDKVFIP